MENYHRSYYGDPFMKTISDEEPQYKELKTQNYLRQITILTESFSSFINPDSQIGFRGTFYYKLEMYDKAIEDFERALNYFKKDEVYNKNKIFETSILLGICYLNKNNIRESSKLFNEVFEQRDINDDTENVRGYVCKGVNYYSRGDINKACEYFKKANNLNGNLQEMVGGIICEIVQKCKCDGIRFVDQAEEFECTRKMLRDKGIL